jgi:uncharacterized protein (TIGR02145 family)
MTNYNYYLTAAGKPCFDVKGPREPEYNADDYNNPIIRKNDFAPENGGMTKGINFHYDNEYRDLRILDPGGIVAGVSQPSNTSGAGSGDTPFTVTFKSGVRDSVLDKGAPITVKLIAQYKINNGNVWEEKITMMNVPVMDAACCPAKTSTVPETWLAFACHNLGGRDIVSYDYTGANNYTMNGNAGTDETLIRGYHGDWYMFGAPVASMKNTVAHDTDNTWDNSYYQNDSYDWSPANNPCPAGWRLPDEAQFVAVNTNNNDTDLGTWTAYGDNTSLSAVKKIGSYLYFPIVGGRNSYNTELSARGSQGQYWCGNANGSNGYFTAFNETYLISHTPSTSRTSGMSLRCVVAE